jgi:hypothetical protein
MILEGFDIENWSCIKKLSVSDLPATGVIVMHGPNRTGKSSAVKALRACLMDFAAGSRHSDLTKFFPRGSGEKPTVTVTFRIGGKAYRIKKQFGTNKSELLSKTSTGSWKPEAASAAEAHDRTCTLVGGNDSDKGLPQLLWLTQAEYHLPKPDEFDEDVQANLRNLLGVLQTPLDDRFQGRVKTLWSTWYSEKGKDKKGSALATKLATLDERWQELRGVDERFAVLEQALRQTADLESEKHGLQQQRDRGNASLKKLEEERERGRARVGAWKLAQERESNAKNEESAALKEQKEGAEAAKRCAEADLAVEPAKQRTESLGRQIAALAERLKLHGKALDTQGDEKRSLSKQADQIAAKRSTLDLTLRLEAAREEVRKAVETASEIEETEKRLVEQPAPDDKTLKTLEENRSEAVRLRAMLDAASMQLSLFPDRGATAARLTRDGEAPEDLLASGEPTSRGVRRKAELFIAGWGRIEMSRGIESTNLDSNEESLRCCDVDFANAMAPFGISALDPTSLDKLRDRVAELRAQRPELDKKKKAFKRLAPNGLDVLQRRVVELQTRLAGVAATASSEPQTLSADASELDRLADDLSRRTRVNEDEIKTAEKDIANTTTAISDAQKEETAAKEALAAATATARTTREQLDRLPTEERTAKRVGEARRGLKEAQAAASAAQLTADEIGIDDRIADARESVTAIEKAIHDIDEKRNQIKGQLIGSEGLHGQRSSLSARVDELTRLTEREMLEKNATNRLVELFEECREKQLDTRMKPIQDRVLSWMRILNIGDYGELRFDDSFLPAKMTSRDGTAEFAMLDESTGAQEQMGMLVRLALGSTLSSADEPAIAILDDPLTHSDEGRLRSMRGILRRASEGDSTLAPPAGPLQIVIFTCHPEWFRTEGATVIDLADPDVMSRLPT